MYPAQAASPAAWLSLKDALYWVQVGKADGVGICLPPGMISLDLDGVFAGGELEGWAAELIEQANTFAEKSPSGVGLHILGYHPAERLPGRLTSMPRVEVLTPGRFLTVTGQVLRSGRLRDLSDLVPIPARPQVPLIRRTSRPMEHAALLDRIARGRSGDLFQKLYVEGDFSSLGYPSCSEGDLALCRLLSWWCQRDVQLIDALYRTSALQREKWDRPVSSSETYGQMTIRKATS
ncbi:hypothetical protein MF271_21585 (plasmid) [Deinococcus sp. KNUC1210]|uniref:phage NrS-1 polymerase family protein n=1 Tax=Deinococcus sp. KNUC1210 TaxID=2917691 RepID=UPI001EEFBDE5|nr:hypothetical protein [Deinococcus sp. KNUC1210]ULH17864.1 hypothetical protein MF271_21585 [Deinococcus sp. KNUC1210]